ncbi:MAG: hypothetical protein LBB45_00340 [Methanobrevibacter sp.]|nr:hypothetical protein [Candidatus Methanovirga basalitermitum]
MKILEKLHKNLHPLDSGSAKDSWSDTLNISGNYTLRAIVGNEDLSIGINAESDTTNLALNQNSVATLTGLSNLPVGEYSVNASFNGNDDYYGSSSDNKTFTVAKGSSHIEISFPDFIVGQSGEIIINLSNDAGKSIADLVDFFILQLMVLLLVVFTLMGIIL